METLAPLILLWALPLYIAGGFLGLLQFKLLYTGLVNASAWRSKLWVWQRLRPGVCAFGAFLWSFMLHACSMTFAFYE